VHSMLSRIYQEEDPLCQYQIAKDKCTLKS
jgi:hypothetical protein